VENPMRRGGRGGGRHPTARGGRAGGGPAPRRRLHDPLCPPRQRDHRGTAEQGIKERKAAVRWTRLSYHSFAANAVRFQLHALAYNLGTFLRTLALPEGVERWTLTTLRERLIKIGARVVSHGR
jgi:DDE family transposase